MSGLNSRQSVTKNISLYSLFFSNLAVIWLAIIFTWSPEQLFMVVLSESLLIGYFHWRRLLSLNSQDSDSVYSSSSTNNADSLWRTITLLIYPNKYKTSPSSKNEVADSFKKNYLGVHLIVFLVFLLPSLVMVDIIDFIIIFTTVVMIYFSHRHAHTQNIKADAARKVNVRTIIYFPFIRSIPLYVIFVYCAVGKVSPSMSVLIFFLTLKTFVDGFLFNMQHKFNQGDDLLNKLLEEGAYRELIAYVFNIRRQDQTLSYKRILSYVAMVSVSVVVLAMVA